MKAAILSFICIFLYAIDANKAAPPSPLHPPKNLNSLPTSKFSANSENHLRRVFTEFYFLPTNIEKIYIAIRKKLIF